MRPYPPPPPGWDSRLLVDAPQEAVREAGLADWARARGYVYNPTPNAAWFQSWAPFVFLPAPARVLREVRVQAAEAQIWLVEVIEEPTAPSADESRAVVAFVLSPRLHCRAAIRSRMQRDAIDEARTSFNPRKTPRSLGRWRLREREQLLRRTWGRGVRGVIGDAIFEAHCEVATPSREEGLAALPSQLRHWLLTTGWRGVLEQRPGGLVSTTYTPPLFDPASLDATLLHLERVFDAVTRRRGPDDGPPWMPAPP